MESTSLNLLATTTYNNNNTTHTGGPLFTEVMERQHQHRLAGRQSNVSTAGSVMGTSTPSYERSERKEDGELYADLRSYITRQRHAWSVTRDIEIAQPLQQRYMGFEAGLIEEIRQAERDNENKRRERAEEMEGATGLIKWSWRLYELRMRLCERWQRRRLRGNWRRNQLNAMKKELNGEYVRLQNGRRADMMKDMISFAGEETVEDADDGAYVWNGLLNYIVYGYERMFPISRELDVETSRPPGV